MLKKESFGLRKMDGRSCIADSDVMTTLFEAIRGHRYITIDNLGKHSNEVRTVRLVPLKLYISAQNGKQNLLTFHDK